MSRKRGRGRGQSRARRDRALSPLASPYGWPETDEFIAYLEDDPDDARLTVTARLVIRVTRPKILGEYATCMQRAMAEAHSPDDFGEFAYLAVRSEGMDEIAEGPAGQLRFLLDPRDVLGTIPGIAIQESEISIEVTQEHETMPHTDPDLEELDRNALITEVKRLRAGIRPHRDISGHDPRWPPAKDASPECSPPPFLSRNGWWCRPTPLLTCLVSHLDRDRHARPRRSRRPPPPRG